MARFKLVNRPWGFIVIFLLLSDYSYGCSYEPVTHEYNFRSGVKVTINYIYRDGLTFEVSRGTTVLQKVKSFDNLSANVVKTDNRGVVTFSGNGHDVQFSVTSNSAGYSEIRVLRSLTRGQSSRDCFDIETDVSWYGGPQQKTQQYWPVNNQRYTEYSYITKEADSNAIAERYWLNSKGVFVYVDPEVPLWITQSAKSLCFSANKKTPYNTDIIPFTFAYRIGVASDPREAHRSAIRRGFITHPKATPDVSMTREPIWSTWAKYKTRINTAVVEAFAAEIVANFGADHSSQFEIDDKWETCYGSLTVNANRFASLRDTVTKLKAADPAGYGFSRVTMWIHPFINKDCDTYAEAKEKGYLVMNATGSTDTEWWQSETGQAGYIDFTNPEAANWFLDRLIKLQQETGLDSFKFDAGESSWAPENPQLYGLRDLNPNILTTRYIETVTHKYLERAEAAMGTDYKNLVEVRSGFRNQDIPVFMRMIDKDTEFDYNNGLPSLVTTLLQLNMAGYPFVLPDMVGGNGYNLQEGEKVSGELFLRWLQANVFMPSIQFSYVPWDVETVSGVSLHH